MSDPAESLWGTILAVLIGAPLAFLSARNLAPYPLVALSSRALVSLFRAVPELISALFFVLAYGFGPIAGVLALALHAAGFFGKFYAEDMENADRHSQEALIAIGANRVKVFAHAIFPEVLPQYIAYTFYILDRNIRMATVIGLVGAGGIGQELKGRYDLYNYAHVGTILIAILFWCLRSIRLAAACVGYGFDPNPYVELKGAPPGNRANDERAKRGLVFQSAAVPQPTPPSPGHAISGFPMTPISAAGASHHQVTA